MSSYDWPPTGGNSGTITSVGLADGSSTPIYTVSGSPVTSVGTLTFTLATQAANLVFAGPTTGSAAQPGFRSLVAADFPFSITNLTDVGTDGIVITNGTGAVLGASPVTLAQHVADSTHNGYLSSADWVTFNAKQAALAITNLTDVGTDGITVTNGTGAVIGAAPVTLSQQVSDSTHNGYLSSANWVTFNAKQAAGNYITALTGDVTAAGPGSVVATLAATSNATLTTISSLVSIGTITTGTWSATTIAINKGGTGVTSVTTAPAATAWAGWDGNSNLSADNFISGYTTTVTAAGTTTLTVTSTRLNYFTGSTTQTGVLPVTSTLVTGMSYTFVNLSSGVVTVQSSGANTLQAMAANTQLVVTCILTSGTGTASWAWVYSSVSAALPMANPMTTGGDLIYGGASGVPTRLANGSANQLLQSNGTTTAPTWVTPLALTTTTSTSPGTSRNFSTITSGGYGAMSGGSVSLAAGTWEIDSYYEANTGTGVTCVMYSNSGLYAANGADSGSAPAALATIGTVSGPATFADTTGGATVASAAAGAGWSVHLTTVLTVASTQTVYAVPRVDFATAGTAAATVYIFARRIY